MRKIFKTILTVALLLGASGCKPKNTEPEEPNAHRGTDYDYDFIDYLDIKAYGPDGKGIIEITAKDYTAADFYSEQEYIDVKTLMDDLNLYYIQGEENKRSNLSVSKVDGLSNGDIVEIGVNTKTWKGSTDLNINLEPYEFVVDTLTEGQEIDLTNNESVIIYGLEGTNNVFALKTPKTATLPKEIEDHIEYIVSTSETNLVEDVSIVNYTCTMDEEFLMNPDNPYYNIDIYLKKHGYDYTSSGQTVLDKIVKPLDFTQTTSNAIGDYLAARFVGEKASTWSREYTIDRIGNIQQDVNAEGIDKFAYTVTFHGVSEEGLEDQFYATMYLWEINTELNLTDFSGFTYAMGRNIIKEPLNENYEVLAQYYYTEEELAQQEAEAAEGEEGQDGEEGGEADAEATATPEG